LFCLQPLSTIRPKKERSDSLNIERFIRIYQKEEKKRESKREKAGVRRKKWEKIGQLTKFGGK
jgi:hypothetical protein